MRLIVIGAGDLGGEVARRWADQGGEAIGLTKTTARHEQLRSYGVHPSTSPAGSLVDPDDVVLLSISGSAGQYAGAMSLRSTNPSRVVMTSTTGFYGGLHGHISPSTAPGPSDRAEAAADAEAAFLALDSARVILRLGGLYREGRGPLAALLRRGSAPPGPPDRPLALLHRDDAATAIIAALTIDSPHAAYVVLTPPLPTRKDFYTLACATHGLPVPQFTERLGHTWSYDTSATTADLLPRPAHPDWREAATDAAPV